MYGTTFKSSIHLFKTATFLLSLKNLFGNWILYPKEYAEPQALRILCGVLRLSIFRCSTKSAEELLLIPKLCTKGFKKVSVYNVYMINARSKGLRVELELEKELERMEWVVWRPGIGGRFQTNRDIFNLFDLVGFKKGDSSLYFIQIKSTPAGFSTAKKKIREWYKTNKPPITNIFYSVFQKIKKGEWRRWDVISEEVVKVPFNSKNI